MHDMFEVGYVDHAIFQPVYLGDFYKNGFHTPEMVAPIAEKHPGLFTVNGLFEPRLGKKGVAHLESLHEQYGLKGVKLYTAEWRGDSRGWKLDSPEAAPCLEKCQELGIKNIHVHKGPTVWPLDRDAFDVADIDGAATNFPELNFIVEHVGLPRLEDFCWIATQEPNVYAGLAVAMPFIHTRPRYFAQIIGELLYWLNEDRILFSSDYAIWQPKWLVEQFVDLQIPEDMQSELGVLTTDVKKKILGLNAAALYDLEVPAELALVSDDGSAAVGSEPLSPA
jgi:predicted TIM-barrel fold metal-dependent hydrolase